ncbi:SigE family RNA polymerase sigma factor [Actinoplanes sp. NPDC049599]|uniref:SigE family RNA polymerase sigma factor n=1 Tax=Actinoplanes sp. NPDC049599 TaxID=3363903 RepID=UPI0037A655C7
MSVKMERADADRAYGEFVARAWDHHLRVARLLTGDPHRAEELLQDCLVKLYSRWHRMSWHQNPDAYLRSMLANGNVSWWRRRRREHLVADSPEQADPRAAPAEPYEELSRALLTLPRRQRAIVVLRHYADLSEKEVAAALDCSVGSVKSQNSRALVRLREVLSAPHHKGVSP